MNGINRVILLGRLGQEPETKEYSGGMSAQFNIATTERGFKTRTGKEIPERTEWHRVVCFGSLANIVSKYTHKGSTVYVEGKIRTRSYEDKSGIKRYVTEIHADSVQMVDRKEQNAAQTPTTEDGDDIPF